MKIKPQSLRGFSLVEVTLALGICSFCLVALVGVLPSGLMATANASRTTTANDIAASLLAELMYVGPTEQLDEHGNPRTDGDGQPIRVFPEATLLYGFPLRASGSSGDDDGSASMATYTSEFMAVQGDAETWRPVSSGGQYFVKATISPVPNPAVEQPYTFTVEVSWPAVKRGINPQGSVVVSGRSRSR